MFLTPICWGAPPNFWNCIKAYKAHPLSDHVTKFHGDQPRDPGERMAKEIKKKQPITGTEVKQEHRSNTS